MRRSVFAIVLLSGGLLPATASAAQVDELDTQHRAGVYSLNMTVTVAAPREQVYAVLTDYENLKTINPAITVSQVLLSGDPEVTRVRTVIKRCVMFFCPELERVEDVRVPEEGVVEAEIVPHHSDFSSGQATWRFEALDGSTRIVYRARFDPDFWIPPLIGPAIIQGALREEARTLFDNAERRARQKAGLPTDTTD